MLACLRVWALHTMSTTSITSTGLYPSPSTGCPSSQEGATVSPYPMSCSPISFLLSYVLRGSDLIWLYFIRYELLMLRSLPIDICSHDFYHGVLQHSMRLAHMLRSSIPLFIDHTGRGLGLSLCFAADLLERRIRRWAILISTFTCQYWHGNTAFMVYLWYYLIGQSLFFQCVVFSVCVQG